MRRSSLSGRDDEKSDARRRADAPKVQDVSIDVKTRFRFWHPSQIKVTVNYWLTSEAATSIGLTIEYNIIIVLLHLIYQKNIIISAYVNFLHGKYKYRQVIYLILLNEEAALSDKRMRPVVTPASMVLSFVAMLAIMGIAFISWEFALEQQILPQLGIPINAEADNLSRWRFIITAVVFAALSQFGPGLLLFRLMRRLDRARMDVIKARDEANVLARYDPLTGLANHRMLRELMRLRLPVTPPTGGYAFLLIDIDRFKAITDLHGLQMGDRLMIEIANRIRAVLPADAVVSRMRGEEFAIFLPRLRTVDALGKMAQQIISRLSTHFRVDNLNVRLDISIGIAVTPENGTTEGDMMRSVEAALYRAKRVGPGNYRFFEPSMDRDLRQSRLLQRDLHSAIASNAIVPHFQPLVRLRDGALIGFEVLARWEHPSQGPVSPEVFIPIAEENGLIDELTQSVLRNACLEASRWPDNLKIAVNLSPIQLNDLALPDRITRTLSNQGFPPRRLEIEITETALTDDSKTANTILMRLRDMGIDIALDDFGTGYSSLQKLRLFPVTKLKIDKSFVTSMNLDVNAKKLISGILALSRHLGIATTAEGIETAAEATYLGSLNCDFGQGYYFAKPMKGSEVQNFLTNHASMLNADH